jgi:pimeloyl-ACP methyl ester carboxylesterase
MQSLKTLAMSAAIGALGTAAHADTYVIVHGAFQTADSWSAVADALRAKGHTAVAVNLPGRNAEGDAAKAVTLAQYAQTVEEIVEQQSEPVILVGHSFGGMTISLAAEAMPEKIRKLIYVAAYVPASGDSMQTLAASDRDNGFTAASFVLSPDYAFATILPDDQRRLFINDGAPDLQGRVTSAMVREPLGPIATPVEVTAGKFGAVEKAYIRTALDATISPALQNMMIKRAGITETKMIKTGHSPQASGPEELADALIALSD